MVFFQIITPPSAEVISTAFCFCFFSFTISFSVFSIFLYILRFKPWCNCDICRSYIKSSWSSEFHNLSDWYTHLLRKSPTGTIHIHALQNTITANPKNMEYVVKTNFENFPKGKPFQMILGDLLGKGIFNVDGHSWKFQRKMASLELGSVTIRSYAFEVVTSEISSKLIPLLEQQNDVVLDMQDIFRRFSFDNICRFSFGLDPGSLRSAMHDSDFAQAFDLASKLSAQRAMAPSHLVWKMKRFFNLGSEKRLREAIQLVNSLAEEMIKQKRTVGCENRHDLLSRFMCTVNDDKYLRDIVISFLLAGRDTVASALTSFFHLLLQNPQVMKEIRDESERVMGSGSGQVLASFDQMKQMRYLHAAIHESLRLFPPVQFDSRFAKHDDVLPDGTLVRRGDRVSYHAYAMGRMEALWGPDCLEFKPERWLKDGVFMPENPFKYPVFHAGFRLCLGKELALVACENVALSLIRGFDIRASEPGRIMRFSPGLTASFVDGLPVVIQERRALN